MINTDKAGLALVLTGLGLIAVPIAAIMGGLVGAAFSYNTGIGLLVSAPMVGAVALAIGAMLIIWRD